MERPGVFEEGTATVAANGTIVTFQNAGSLSWLRPGDRFGGHVGLGVRIAEVGPGNGLTASQVRLAYPWRGAAQTAAAYEIEIKSDEGGFRQSIKELIDTYGDGVLPAFAGLTLAANKGIHATGAGALATHDLTPYARTLLDDANAAAMYATLGQISNTSLPGRLRELSAPIPSNDFNLALSSGFYVGPGAPAVNGPPGLGAYGPLLVLNRNNGAIIQISGFFRPAGSGTPLNELYTRGSSDGGANWTQWLPLIAAGGINANGTFVRFADGTQICSHRHSASGITSIQRTEGSVVNGHFYNFSPVTFPAAFAFNPIISMVSDEVLLGTSARVFSGMQCYGANSSNFSYRVWATLSFDRFAARYVAIGRWF